MANRLYIDGNSMCSSGIIRGLAIRVVKHGDDVSNAGQIVGLSMVPDSALDNLKGF